MKTESKWKSSLREIANDPAMSSIIGNAIGAILAGGGTMIYNSAKKRRIMENVLRNTALGGMLGGGIGFSSSYFTREKTPTMKDLVKRIETLENKL